MTDGGQSRKKSTTTDREEVDEQATATRDEETEEVLDDVDELLDEIDEVLEENAEEFIKNYVQKGGQ